MKSKLPYLQTLQNKCDLATWCGYCANETKDFDPLLTKTEREREEKDYFIEYFYEHMSTHLIETSCSNL